MYGEPIYDKYEDDVLGIVESQGRRHEAATPTIQQTQTSPPREIQQSGQVTPNSFLTTKHVWLGLCTTPYC